MYIPALGWEFLASTRLTSELNFLLQEIDNCYHRAAEGRAPKIEKQIQREIIENAEKEKSPEQNLFEKYLERRGRSNFLAKLYLARHLFIIFLSIIPVTYLSTYYATQKQNEFTCALGEPPDKTSNSKLLIRVNCKLPSVQLQRIIAGVDIVLLCFMNLIILINLIHLFIFRKSNFIFDKLNKVGIKTKKQWQKSQFCDINILAMFCNENRDHIKSLNRLDFITNESDLMYDNVVRQLLAALAQSNHDVTPTVRDSGIQTIDPSINPTDLGPSEPLIIKRPRKKMKWIPSSNPLPQPFKEQLAIMKVENSKPENLIAPLLETNSKPIQPSPVHKTESNTPSSTGNEKKHTRHFSLDVHPYILSNKKPKQEIPSSNSMAISKSQESGFLNPEDKAIVLKCFASLSDSSLPGNESLYSHDICRTVPATGVFLTCTHNHIATSGAATKVSLPHTNKVVESGPALNCHPVHPLLHINTLYEDHEEEGSSLIEDSLDNRIHSPAESGDIISMPSTKQIMLATFDEPLAIVNSAEY
uniref:Pannexin 2 n=1 Tax=Naja naja TaxID=35670 RepID=A0A8C6VJP1_NAJNA